MANRQILYFPGTSSVPGYPDLDVTESEIALANMAGRVYWPGLFDWDVNNASTGFRDRVTDAAAPVEGVVNVAKQFGAAPNGKNVYNIGAAAHNPIAPPFDTTGSFTIGLVVEQNIAMGSFSAAAASNETPAPWFVITGTTGADIGKPWIQFGALTSGGYAGYSGSPLAAGVMNRVVLIVDRGASKITLRVNGVVGHTVTHALVNTAAVFSELKIGAARPAGANSSQRSLKLGAVIAFTRALAGDDLATLEAHLAEVAAA